MNPQHNVVPLRQPLGRHFTILTREQILADREPAWLVEGLYTQDSLATVIGNPEAYKTFFALGIACSIATGKPFLGSYPVKRQGDVVYIYGEGGRGIGRRLHAWEVHNGCDAERFFGIPQPVDMLGEQPEQVIADIKDATVSPVLIVLDTLARCFGSGDENSTKDMNAFVRGCDLLRRAFPDCTVLVVHHTGWEGTRARGARAWEGALDTATKLERHDSSNLARLSVTKQKDFAKPGGAIHLELVDVPGTGSAVLRLADPALARAVTVKNDDKALEVLSEAGEAGLTAGDWQRLTGINKDTHKGVRKRLGQKGLAVRKGRRWFATPEPQVSPAIQRELAT